MTETMEAMKPAVRFDAANWFEIPTSDLDRAAKFYEQLLGAPLLRENSGEPMAFFPCDAKGVGGALIDRASQRPSEGGALIYLNCDGGLDAALERLRASGQGAVVLGKRAVPGGFGYVACIRDSEGNHVALHEH
jgi:predicted enzyme related to lactoylglutathione lyase